MSHQLLWNDSLVIYDNTSYNSFYGFRLIKNIELITLAMTILKKRYPEMAFFVINTQHGHCIKTEIFEDHLEEKDMGDQTDYTQPGLFDL